MAKTKYDFTGPVVTYAGEEVKDPDTGKAVYLAALMATAITYDAPGEKVDTLDRLRRDDLARRIACAKAPIELSDDDLALIVVRGGDLLSTQVVGQLAARIGVEKFKDITRGAAAKD
jgi:hypothetical protein